MNSDFTQAEAHGIDKEHTIQIQMLNLLTKAVSENNENSEKEEILDQLISFSQVHFMSEKLVMRQHSYPGYDEHEDEHGALMDSLYELKAEVQKSPAGLDLKNLHDIRQMLVDHIASQDKRFSAFLADLPT
jgi:hemerythrin-like metal-binding protein